MKTTITRKTRAMTAAETSDTTGKAIEFTLDMPQAKTVAVAGTFNRWQPMPMRKSSSNGKWRASVILPPGKYEYRFIVDEEWVDDPQAKESVVNPFGGRNAILVVAKEPMLLAGAASQPSAAGW